MRIVYVTPHYRPVVGGAELHVQALAEHHAARGHAVTVFTLRTSNAATGAVDPSLPVQEDVGGVRVIRFEPDQALRARWDRLMRVRGAWRLSRALLSPAQITALSEGPWVTGHVRRVLWSRPDVITTVNWGFAEFVLPFYLARRLVRTPLVGMPLLHTEIAWTDSPATADLIAGSDAILANTQHEVDFCVARGFPEERMYVCGAGCEPDDFVAPDGRRVRARYGLGDDPVVGYVGRMQVDKGVPLLVEAMRAVWRSHPRARLLLAGRDVPSATYDHDAFQAALGALDPAERARVVHVDGFPAADKASIFAACDIYAMSSISDSFGQTYLEAWLCGRPVIGAGIPAVSYVIDHGVDGLLVAPRSAPALTAAIVELLDDPRRRDAMGAAGGVKARTRFAWPIVTDRVEAAYRAIVDRGRRSLARAS